MDILADVLAGASLGRTDLARAELIAPWALEVDAVAQAHIHVVQRGSCWLSTKLDREAVELQAGDVIWIRGGVAHSIGDRPGTRPLPSKRVLEAMPRRLANLSKAQRRATTVVLCAKYAFLQQRRHPLLALLPAVIHLPASQAQKDRQLNLLIQILAAEAAELRGGSELVIPRLVDSLLVFVMRQWVEKQPVHAGGWFMALRDPAVSRALTLIHDEPHKTWSVEGLARSVGQSRATFARRFGELVGESPVAYVTLWRMCLAVKLLSESDHSVDQVARRVGYETASAFSKAFRRIHGRSPGAFRASQRPPSAGPRRARRSD